MTWDGVNRICAYCQRLGWQAERETKTIIQTLLICESYATVFFFLSLLSFPLLSCACVLRFFSGFPRSPFNQRYSGADMMPAELSCISFPRPRCPPSQIRSISSPDARTNKNPCGVALETVSAVIKACCHLGKWLYLSFFPPVFVASLHQVKSSAGLALDSFVILGASLCGGILICTVKCKNRPG